MSELPRELEAFLAGLPAERPSTAFRERLLDETEILLPRPWMPRRFAVGVAALCVLTVLGVISLKALVSRPGVPPAGAVPAPLVLVESNWISEIASAPLSPAEALEWQALESPEQFRPALYWNAGQAYIADEGDYLSALRCYRQALEGVPPELCEVTDEDDLLAMVLKFDRAHKEKKNDAP